MWFSISERIELHLKDHIITLASIPKTLNILGVMFEQCACIEFIGNNRTDDTNLDSTHSYVLECTRICIAWQMKVKMNQSAICTELCKSINTLNCILVHQILCVFACSCICNVRKIIYHWILILKSRTFSFGSMKFTLGEKCTLFICIENILMESIQLWRNESK